jgi:protein TonB
MSNYGPSSFLVAAVISLTVHAAAVVYIGHHKAPFADPSQSADRAMQISLAATRPAAPATVTPATPGPASEPKPRPLRKPSPPPAVRREPPPQPLIAPRPANTEVTAPAEPVEEQAIASRSVEAPLETPSLEQVSVQNERQSYLQRLLAHIDSHKFYPRSARRRGTEGEIQVAFYLRKDGNISDLQITGGSKVLRTAAKQAVQQALSLPPPPESMPLQEPVRFSMVYRLDG